MMIELIDQTGSMVRLENYPKRIICLVPSITELLYDLGLDEEVVGITKFCVHPAHWFKTKTRVGGTKTVSIEKIRSLAPDLIIANKEENVKEQIEELAADYPVYVSDISILKEALEMIEQVGLLTGKKFAAEKMIAEIKDQFDQIVPLKISLRTCYLIWQNPFITIGGDTFINNMLEKCGLKNIADDQLRYPEISLKQIADLKCELLLLSSEPFPFKEKHIHQINRQLQETGATPGIELVDGEMFSWYGSRLLKAPHYFKQLQQILICGAADECH